MIGLLNCKLINSALILQTVKFFFLMNKWTYLNVNEQIFAKIKTKKTKKNPETLQLMFFKCFLICTLLVPDLKRISFPLTSISKCTLNCISEKWFCDLKFNKTLDHLLKQYLFFFSFKCKQTIVLSLF